MKTALRTINVHYFALLKEQSGLSQERCETTAGTAIQLYEELSARYRFSLPAENLKVAVNDRFADWGTELAPGDRVTFLPPVSGG